MKADQILDKQMRTIAGRVSAILEKKEWTQRDLADKSGMKDSAISRILHAETNLTLRTIVILELALGEKLIELVTD